MSKIVRSGDIFSFAASDENLLEGLPPGNYIIVSTPKGYVFQRQVSFKPLGRLYGDHETIAQRIYRSFKERTGNTGVLLAGVKGSGKSFLGRLLSKNAEAEGIPTILITSEIKGEILRELLSELDHPAVILIDEFEKIYSSTDSQLTFLSLLDGLSTTKHLFVLTVNKTEKVDFHMKNRPGRLYYLLEFHGLEERFIREFCAEKLVNKEHIDAVVELTMFFQEFNFDMLNSLVEEMNRFDESPRDAVRFLNISPLSDLTNTYDLIITNDDGIVLGNDQWHGNPLTTEVIELHWWNEAHKVDARNSVTLKKEHMIARDPKNGIYTYRNEDITVVFTLRGRTERKKTHWTEQF